MIKRLTSPLKVRVKHTVLSYMSPVRALTWTGGGLSSEATTRIGALPESVENRGFFRTLGQFFSSLFFEKIIKNILKKDKKVLIKAKFK